MIDKKILNKKDCMGCHGCENICPENCISMNSDKEGFLYPTVDYSKCINCNRCIDVCPIINKTDVDNNPVTYACMNKNEEIRLISSSGGIYTLLGEYVIDQDGVVFGAGFNNQFEVVHQFVEKKENLNKLRGSKYVQSKILDNYKKTKDFLDKNRKVLFSGTPCQIAGLKLYLGKTYNNLITVDFICHGVPSPKVWGKYIQYREEKADSKTERIALRLKNEGWKRYSVSFNFMNDTEYRQNLKNDLYMKAFLKDVCLRPSCYECEFKGLERHSDITLADFWGIQNVLPEMDDDKGTSLIFINTDFGKDIFKEIKDSMVYEEVDINEVVKYNSAAVESAKYNPNREKFMEEIDSLSFDKLVKKYCDGPLNIKIKRKIKLIIKKILIKTKMMKIVKKLIKK